MQIRNTPLQDISVNFIIRLLGFIQTQHHIGGSQPLAFATAPPSPTPIAVLGTIQPLERGVDLSLQLRIQLRVR